MASSYASSVIFRFVFYAKASRTITINSTGIFFIVPYKCLIIKIQNDMLLLTYDLVQNDDSQLNTEIKNALIDLGWRDDVTYWCKPSCRPSADTATDTTLWKGSGFSQDGVDAFEAVCTAYNTRHVREKLRARGKAICVRFSADDQSLLKLG